MWVVLAAVCVVLIASFGLPLTELFSPKKEKGIAKIYDTEISQYEFNRELERRVRYFRDQFGPENFERFRAQLNLDSQVREGMINSALREHFAGQLGFTAGPDAIKESLREMPFFKGRELDQESVRSFLYAIGLSEAEFEALQKKEIVENQLRSLFSDVSIPSEPELKNIFRQENTSYQFRYLELKSADFENKVDTSHDEAVQTFFTANQERFRKPKTIRYSFVRFLPADFAGAVEVNEDELRTLYNDRAPEFVEPKQFLLRKIFFKVDKEPAKDSSPLADLLNKGEKKDAENKDALQSELSPKQKKQEFAKGVIERLDAGEDFKKVASEVSEDKDSAAKAGEMPWMTAKQNSLSPAMRTAAFALGVGEHSAVVDDTSGLYVFYLEDIKDAKQKPFEEVRPLLDTEFRKADAPLYAQEKANAFFNSWKAHPDEPLVDAAKTANYSAVSSNELLSLERDPQGAGRGLTARVMDFEKDARELVELKDAIYAVQVEELKDSYLPDLKEVRDTVVKEFIKDQSKTLARKEADSVLEQLVQKSGETKEGLVKPVKGLKSLADAAKDRHLILKSSESVTRGNPTGDLFTIEHLHDLLFQLTEETPLLNQVFDRQDQFYIVELEKRSLPDEKQFAEKKSELQKKELTAAATRLTETLDAVLRNEAVAANKLKLTAMASATDVEER